MTEQPKQKAWEKAWEKFLNARFPGRDLPNWCGPDATTRENFIYAYFEGVATQQEELERMKWELAAEVERFAEMVRQCESETKHESLAMVKPFCDSVVSRATLLSALCDLADELVAVKAELAAVREGVGAFMDERMEVLRRTYGHDSSKVAGARWMAECVKDHFDALLK